MLESLAWVHGWKVTKSGFELRLTGSNPVCSFHDAVLCTTSQGVVLFHVSFSKLYYASHAGFTEHKLIGGLTDLRKPKIHTNLGLPEGHSGWTAPFPAVESLLSSDKPRGPINWPLPK
jgi:hypothetical protein